MKQFSFQWERWLNIQTLAKLICFQISCEMLRRSERNSLEVLNSLISNNRSHSLYKLNIISLSSDCSFEISQVRFSIQQQIFAVFSLSRNIKSFSSRRFISSPRKEIQKDFFSPQGEPQPSSPANIVAFACEYYEKFDNKQISLLALKIFSFALVSSYYDHSTMRGDEMGSIRSWWHGWEIPISHGVD